MKIKLEFEAPDLHEMLTGYFDKLGFTVKNIDELCEQFTAVFPEGLVVHAEIAALPEENKTEPVVVKEADAAFALDTFVLTTAPELKEERRLSHADLLDPTTRTPDDDARDAAEIRKIRDQSNDIIASRKN